MTQISTIIAECRGLHRIIVNRRRGYFIPVKFTWSWILFKHSSKVGMLEYTAGCHNAQNWPFLTYQENHSVLVCWNRSVLSFLNMYQFIIYVLYNYVWIFWISLLSKLFSITWYLYAIMHCHTHNQTFSIWEWTTEAGSWVAICGTNTNFS